jgi:hypothetical protein
MTSRQCRTERRAAERKARKIVLKTGNPLPPAGSPVSQTAPEPENKNLHAAPPSPNHRAQTNRANAQRSTGPRTSQGKLASSRNSLKHGLASAQLMIPGEDPAAFDRLFTALLDEHQPANPTQELLVQEIAQSYWLTQRAIRFQNQCFTPDGVDEKRLALFLRYQTTHERAFHRSLSTLIQLKKDRARGFVSQPGPQPKTGFGFVSQNAEPDGLVLQEYVESGPWQAAKMKLESLKAA